MANHKTFIISPKSYPNRPNRTREHNTRKLQQSSFSENWPIGEFETIHRHDQGENTPNRLNRLVVDRYLLCIQCQSQFRIPATLEQRKNNNSSKMQIFSTINWFNGIQMSRMKMSEIPRGNIMTCWQRRFCWLTS